MGDPRLRGDDNQGTEAPYEKTDLNPFNNSHGSLYGC